MALGTGDRSDRGATSPGSHASCEVEAVGTGRRLEAARSKGRGRPLEGQLLAVMIEVQRAVVVNVENTHGVLEVGVPGHWEMHGER
jgi:hypothetical protein